MLPFCLVCFEHLVRLLSGIFYLRGTTRWTEFAHGRDQRVLVGSKVRNAMDLGIEAEDASHIFCVKVTDTHTDPFNGKLDFLSRPDVVRHTPRCIQHKDNSDSILAFTWGHLYRQRPFQRRMGVASRSISTPSTDNNQSVSEVAYVIFDVSLLFHRKRVCRDVVQYQNIAALECYKFRRHLRWGHYLHTEAIFLKDGFEGDSVCQITFRVYGNLGLVLNLHNGIRLIVFWDFISYIQLQSIRMTPFF